MQGIKGILSGVLLTGLLIGCATHPHKKRPALATAQASPNAKPIYSKAELGMSTNEVIAVLGKPFFTTLVNDQTEIWTWPSPKTRLFDNHFVIISEGKVVFVPEKPDSTPADEMDAAWAFINQKPGVSPTRQVDWDAKTAGILAGDSPEIALHKLGMDKWWDQYGNLYASVIAPNLDLFVLVFENNKVLRTQSLPYNDYFAFTRNEKEQAQRKIRADYVASHPTENQSIKDFILQQRLCVGMNPEQVELAWGHPEKKNVSDRPSGRTEEWIYPDRTYLYFSEGKLLSWQKTH